VPGRPALPCPRPDCQAHCACSGLIKFRRAHPLLGRAEFLGPQDITWHEEHWDNLESKFLAFSLHDRCAWPLLSLSPRSEWQAGRMSRLLAGYVATLRQLPQWNCALAAQTCKPICCMFTRLFVRCCTF
jgi:hypothetical protein